MPKLDFKLTEMNKQMVYLAEPYKVLSYDWDNNGRNITKWYAFHRIYNSREKIWMFGDSIDYDTMGKSREYNTKEEAMEACQEHYNKTLKEVIC